MKLVIAGVGVVAVLGGGSAIAAASAAPSGVSFTTGATADLSATATAAGSGSGTTAAVTRKQAIAIAKKKVPGARVTEVEREWEHGHRTWKIELHKGAWEYEVYVAISNGKIIKFDKDYDD